MQFPFRIFSSFYPHPHSDSDSSSYSYSYSSPGHSYSSYFDDKEFFVYVLTQLAPFFVLLGVPALALLARAHWRAFLRFVEMVLESLFGATFPLSLPWNWGSHGGSGGRSSGEKAEERRKRKKERKKERSRVGSSQSESTDRESDVEDEDEDLYYPGLVNISGTYCFLNSVLQATASLAYLQPYLDAIHARAVDLDVPTPVVDTLQETLQALNTPKSSRSSLRPVPIINALSQPAPGTGGKSKLFASREHQDAQELFQLLSECIKNEAQAVDAEAQRDRGLGAFASPSLGISSRPGSSASLLRSGEYASGGEVELTASSVFDGLTANRRSCVACGYTEAVMHFAFATWSLALPSVGFGSSSCTLQECLSDYTRLELLTDCVCRRCSMRATFSRLSEEADKLAEATKPGGPASGSQYKKKKAKEMRKMERFVRSLIEEGRIEEEVPKGVKMERVVSPASTKQAMIARPPKVLVLHLNRSLHFSSYSSPSRNPIRVLFPEILDLTPYTTSGQLSTTPSAPISTPPPPLLPNGLGIPRSTTPTQGMYEHPRVLYRLSAVVAHYGAHSFGHYVCFRRKPRFSRKNGRGTKEGKGRATPMVPQMPCPYGCDCTVCATYGPVRDFDPSSSTSSSLSSSLLNSQSQSQPDSRSNENPRSHSHSHGYRARKPSPYKGWLRTSDDSVEEVGLERVLAEGSGAFLLFYERVRSGWVASPRPYTPGLSSSSMVSVGMGPGSSSSSNIGVGIGGVGVGGIGRGIGLNSNANQSQNQNHTIGIGVGNIYQHLKARETPRSSEETVRPADVVVSSSASSFVSSSASSFVSHGEESGVSSSVSSSLSGSGIVRPRVVRRTTAGRRERSRDKRREREKEKVDQQETNSKGKEKATDEDEVVIENVDAVSGTKDEEKGKWIPNGSAVPLPNGSALHETDLDAVEGEGDGEGDGLSESIVKVDLPSPPRSRSTSPGLASTSTSKAKKKSQIPLLSTSTSTSNSTSNSQTLSTASPSPPMSPNPSTSPSSPPPNNSAGPDPSSPQSPQTGSPTSSPTSSPLSSSSPISPISPSRKRKTGKNKSRIPRAKVSTPSSTSVNSNVNGRVTVNGRTGMTSPSRTSAAASGSGSGILVDRAAVGLRA